MSTVADITEVLPKLTDEELRTVERALLKTYRARRVSLVLDDQYGSFTEEDLAMLQGEALNIIDGKTGQS